MIGGAACVVLGVAGGFLIVEPLGLFALVGFIAMMLAGYFYLYDHQQAKATAATSGFAVFDDGFGVWNGENAKHYRWRDVGEFWSFGAADQSVWSLTPRTGADSFRIVTRSGERIEVPSTVENYRGLLMAIEEGCTEAIWARVRESLATGGDATFGRYGVSNQSIRKVDKRISWRDVERIEKISGRRAMCKFYCHGSTLADLTIEMAEIPNHQVFDRLLDQMAGGARTSA